MLSHDSSPTGGAKEPRFSTSSKDIQVDVLLFYPSERPVCTNQSEWKGVSQSSDNHNAIERGGLIAVFLCLQGPHKQVLQDRIRRKQ